MSHNDQSKNTAKNRFANLSGPVGTGSPSASTPTSGSNERQANSRFKDNSQKTVLPLNSGPADSPHSNKGSATRSRTGLAGIVAPNMAAKWPYLLAGAMLLMAMIILGLNRDHGLPDSSKTTRAQVDSGVGAPGLSAKAKAQMTDALQAMYDFKQSLGEMNDSSTAAKARDMDEAERSALEKLGGYISRIDNADTSDCPEDFRQAYEANSLAAHSMKDSTKDLLETMKAVMSNPLMMLGQLANMLSDYLLRNGGQNSSSMPEAIRHKAEEVRSAVDKVRSTYNTSEAVAFNYHVSPRR